jgi:hypothetical protein
MINIIVKIEIWIEFCALPMTNEINIVVTILMKNSITLLEHLNIFIYLIANKG